MTDETIALNTKRDVIAKLLYERYGPLKKAAGGEWGWDDLVPSGPIVAKWRGVADLVVNMLKDAEAVGREKAVFHPNPTDTANMLRPQFNDKEMLRRIFDL